MQRFWKRRGGDDLEVELRANRPEPRPELVRSVVDRVRADRPRRMPAPLRLGLAGALSSVMVVAFALAGGFGYAGSGVQTVVDRAANVVSPKSKPENADKNPGQDQYKPGKGCGDPNHTHDRHDECKVSMSNASVKEGNSGTTSLVYTVSLDLSPLSAVTQGMSEVKSVVAQGPTTVKTSPGQDQYKPGKGCGDKNHLHDRRFQCKASVNDVSQNEGNSGTTSFVFTVSLSDSPVDTVTLVYATANGTALAGSDYVPVAGTTLTFPAGVSALSVTVPVIGDTTREANEAFYVNLSNPSANALILDGQGVGTIVNDDR